MDVKMAIQFLAALIELREVTGNDFVISDMIEYDIRDKIKELKEIIK
jgi:hypothetical protein